LLAAISAVTGPILAGKHMAQANADRQLAPVEAAPWIDLTKSDDRLPEWNTSR
jgi:hypothetical protein